VDVAERGGEQVAPTLAGAEHPSDLEQVLGRRVEPAVLDAFAAHVVLGAADHAALDFERHARPGALRQEFQRNAQVLRERQRRAVEHVRVEQRRLARLAPPQRFCEKRPDERVELVRGAVIGVERDEDAVVTRDLVGEGRERPRPALAVTDGGAGNVRRTAGRQLQDAVGFGLGEAPQRGVQSFGGAHVDRWVRVAARRGGVEHVRVLLGVGNAHADSVAEWRVS
jgi:hypothetical protein